jgi:hypothetical protein
MISILMYMLPPFYFICWQKRLHVFGLQRDTFFNGNKVGFGGDKADCGSIGASSQREIVIPKTLTSMVSKIGAKAPKRARTFVISAKV